MSNPEKDSKLILHTSNAPTSGDAHISEGTASAFSDGELTERGVERVLAHTVDCELCRELVEETQRMRAAVSELLAASNALTARDALGRNRVQARVLQIRDDSLARNSVIDDAVTSINKRTRINLSRPSIWRNRTAVIATTGIVVLAGSAIAALTARNDERVSRLFPWAADSAVHVRMAYKKLPAVIITGTVKSEEGFPISNAAVVVMGESLSRGIRTDSNGNFDLGGLPRTAVKLEIRALGFKTTTIPLQYHDANSLLISAKLVREVLKLDPTVIRPVQKAHK
ncbi:MAG: carboxypeptidase-like regulatory domain-containing protein [Gemmatimonadaceae bacterium]